MKKFVALIGLMLLLTTAKAQFPTVDSLRDYINFNIRNSAVKAFTNLRLNTALNGMLDLIDAAGGAGSSAYVDSIWTINDSTARYRKGGNFYTFSIKGVYDRRRKVDSLYMLNDTLMRMVINGEARTLIIRGVSPTLVEGGPVVGHRGISSQGTRDVYWGGTPLDSAVDIDQDGFSIAFHDGSFVHGTGDFVSTATEYSKIANDENGFTAASSDGAGNIIEFNLSKNSGGQITMFSTNDGGNSSFSLGNDILTFWNANGNLTIPFLIDSTQSHTLQYDPETGKVTYGVSSGGGDSGRFGVEDVAATADRNFDQAGFSLTIHDGPLVHGTGDFINMSSAYSTLKDVDAFFLSDRFDGDVTTTINNTLSSGGQVILQALKASTSQVANIYVSPDVVTINQSDGNINLTNLIDSVQGKILFWNEMNGKVTASAFSASSIGRFGVSGEDDAAGEDRLFALGTHNFSITTGVTDEELQFSRGAFNLLVANASDPTQQGNIYSGSVGSAFSGFGANFGDGHSVNIEAYADNGQSQVDIDFGADATWSMDGNGNTWEWYLEDLTSGTSTKMLYWNPSTKKVTVGDLFGAVGSGGSKVFAVNGLNNVNDSTVSLGGSLTGNTTIAGGSSYKLSVTGSGSGRSFEGVNSSSGSGVYGSSSSGIGGEFASTTGTALTSSSGNLSAQFQRGDAGTNTSAQVISITHIGGSVANGFGGHIAYTLETSTGSTSTAGRIGAVWTDATTATRTSKLQFDVTNNALELTALNLFGSGQMNLPEYGNGTFSGTTAYLLGTDISGNVIEVDAGTVGGAETNTISATITTTNDQVLPGEAILQYVLVKPASALTGVKVGTASDDDYYVTATPIAASGAYTTLVVNEYVPASSLTVRISGITSSTDIKLIYKLLH